MYITVTADENDADYITKRTLITQSEYERIMPVIDAIVALGKATKRQNWRNTEPEDFYFTHMYPNIPEELLEHFNDMYVPRNEYGIHTIISITIEEVIREWKLF
jgi:hypothetical protein